LLSTFAFSLLGCASPAAAPPSTEAKVGAEVRSSKPAEPAAPAHAEVAPAPSQAKPANPRRSQPTIPVESVRFVKDGAGQYWWVTLNRYEGSLLKWHKIQFAPGKQDEDNVSLTLTGKDKGIAPMPHVPAALNVLAPLVAWRFAPDGCGI
jgi:hypothetical protein